MEAVTISFQALILHKQYPRAQEFARRQIELAQTPLHRMEWVLCLAQCHISLDEFKDAAQVLQVGVEDCGNTCPLLVARALILNAAIHAILGFYEDAQQYWDRAQKVEFLLHNPSSPAQVGAAQIATSQGATPFVTEGAAADSSELESFDGWTSLPILYSGFVSGQISEADFANCAPGFLVSAVRAEATRRRFLSRQ